MLHLSPPRTNGKHTIRHMHKDSQIIAELTEIAQNGRQGQTPDECLITRIDALNRICDICEEEDISATPLLAQRNALYPQIIEAIDGRDIADCAPLIQALYRLIYGDGLGLDSPNQWIDKLISLSRSYLSACEHSSSDTPADYTAILAYSIIGESQEKYEAANHRCNQLLDTLADSDLSAMSLSRKIELLYARITTAGIFSFPSSTAPRWANLADTIVDVLHPLQTADGSTTPLATLSDTNLLRWHTTLTLLPTFRLLPNTILTHALTATRYFITSRHSLRLDTNIQ